MKALKIFTLLFLLGLLFSACGLFEPEDPYKRAKEIHRFFRCKVNGKEWYNKSSDWFYGDLSAIEYYVAPDSVENSGRFIMSMEYYPDDNTLESLSISILRDLKEGENITPFYQYGVYKPYTKLYKTDESYNNYVFIDEIDSTNRIIAGKFEFRAITEDGRDTVLITDGEFDWKPNWYIY